MEEDILRKYKQHVGEQNQRGYVLFVLSKGIKFVPEYEKSLTKYIDLLNSSPELKQKEIKSPANLTLNIRKYVDDLVNEFSP